MRLLERDFYTLIRNVSFSTPIDVGSHNPFPWGPSVLAGTPLCVWHGGKTQIRQELVPLQFRTVRKVLKQHDKEKNPHEKKKIIIDEPYLLMQQTPEVEFSKSKLVFNIVGDNVPVAVLVENIKVITTKYNTELPKYGVHGRQHSRLKRITYS